MAYLMRNRCREILSIQRSLQNFRLEDTQCFDPNDRKLVDARIAQVWGKTEKFNQFVQGQLASEMAASTGAADLPPMWLDIVIALPWMPFFTLAGLVQTADRFPFWQYMFGTLGEIIVIFPFAMMWWSYFAFKIYQHFDAHRPKLTVFLIGIWSIVNCTFGACVYGEFAYNFVFHRPPWQSVPLLTGFLAAHQYATYYFHAVEKRSAQCEWTLASKTTVGLYWIVTLLLVNMNPAAIGCEHWLCVSPHPPSLDCRA